MKSNLVLSFLFLFTFFFPQDYFVYKKIPKEILSKIAVTEQQRVAVKKLHFQGAKDLTSYLPSNYDRSGNTDYTLQLQKGLNENSLVIMPDFLILIGPQGLQLKSNSKVLFQKNSKLVVKENTKEFYSALNFENVDKVEVYFANLIGERYQHLSTKGEWGMGIYIVHSKNIFIEKPIITKFWGDGVYIGKLEGITSSNIIINAALIDENRRNGISIIAGENIEIKSSIISNTYGTSPEYGIDVEPNKPEDVLNKITLTNNITYNNSKGGLLFALDNLQGKNAKEINVQVNNYIDYYSEKGIEFHIDRGYQKFTTPIKGTITIIGANLLYNKIPMISNDSKQSQIQLNLINLKTNNKKLSNSTINNFVNKFRLGKEDKMR